MEPCLWSINEIMLLFGVSAAEAKKIQKRSVSAIADATNEKFLYYESEDEPVSL